LQVARDIRQYARIAVDMASSRKLAGADPRTKWLDIVGVLWSVQNLTDGQITPQIICASAGVPTKFGKELLARDRWHEKGHHCPDCAQPYVSGDVVIHHFDQHQDSADVIRKNRDERAKSGRLANHVRWKHTGPIEECARCSE
jgi:hypothetical protein